MNDNIKIQFQGLYLPIHNIALNKVGQGIHKLTENEEVNDFIYYETKVIEMNKVLTIRTKNLFINSTQFSYVVLIKDTYNTKDDKKFTIKPGESIPFSREMYNSKISLKTIDDDDFSNFISAKKLIFKTEVDHTNYIKSGDTFTMVRKKPNSTMKDCFDVHLIPPIRIKNGLPVSMFVSMVGKDIQFILGKSEEKHISFYSPEPDIELAINIDGFIKASIPVKFLKKSYEKYVTLRAEENKHSYLNVYASFTDDKAG